MDILKFSQALFDGKTLENKGGEQLRLIHGKTILIIFKEYISYINLDSFEISEKEIIKSEEELIISGLSLTKECLPGVQYGSFRKSGINTSNTINEISACKKREEDYII